MEIMLFRWGLVVLHLCSHTVGQRYCTVYFFDQMLWLLFILLLILCGYYSSVVFISLESPDTSTMAG